MPRRDPWQGVWHRGRGPAGGGLGRAPSTGSEHSAQGEAWQYLLDHFGLFDERDESWNCGVEGETGDPAILALRRRHGSLMRRRFLSGAPGSAARLSDFAWHGERLCGTFC